MLLFAVLLVCLISCESKGKRKGNALGNWNVSTSQDQVIYSGESKAIYRINHTKGDMIEVTLNQGETRYLSEGQSMDVEVVFIELKVNKTHEGQSLSALGTYERLKVK